jgi:hypothetical protein
MRLWAGAILLAAAAAACSGDNVFVGTVGGTGTISQNGSIQGVVTANGAGVGNITVVIVGGDSARTAGNGRFVIANVPPSAYNVSIRVPINFSLAPANPSTRSVTVLAGVPTIVNWELVQAPSPTVQ